MPLSLKRRLGVLGATLLVVAAGVSVAVVRVPGESSSTVHASPATKPFCASRPQLCTETSSPWNYQGEYTGHDEPSVLYYSNHPGSGYSSIYQLVLPKDPPTPPNQAGTGGTANFQLHPAIWFGMAMCDDQSAPNPGKACPADSNANIYTSTNPNSPDYLGNTPGQAYMEMQFYPPNWDPVSCTDASGNNYGQWCAALNIDSFQSDSNTGVANNSACLDAIGQEPVNYAIITKSGKAAAPANPFTPFYEQATTTSDTLEMNPGDHLIVDMHDTPAGFQVVIYDKTTGATGSMTASIANGFGHALYQPDASTCTGQLYAYHPMFATSTPQTRVLWAAHSYNVAYSDEIGHFEYCDVANPADYSCAQAGVTDPAGLDGDDQFCFTSGPQVLTGCLSTDGDFDGPEYANNWPGTLANVQQDQLLHAQPVTFSSPLFRNAHGNGLLQYDQVAFEADMPRIEGADISPNNNCQRHVYNPSDPSPGAGCVNPPNGASFYPIYSTVNIGGQCYWEEGGAYLPGATNTFGGSSTTEYGHLLENIYPTTGYQTQGLYETFHRTLPNNPCAAPRLNPNAVS